MARYYPDEFLDEVLQRNDIVDVVSPYVRLTRKGRNHWGICPFHGEKTPSFSVNADKQMYYCFGCHAGGGVFQFIQAIEKCEFPEAVELLAARVGLELPKETNTREPESTRAKTALYEACRMAARFYHEQLYESAGEKALAYLRKRGLDERIIKRFGLGFAPESGNAMLQALTAQGVDVDAMKRAMLVGQKESRVYDYFRNRVMFPIIDRQGRVVAFGGRVMDDSQPKYLNSPETEIFKKRATLYAINIVHKTRDLSQLVLVEGYMDVISMHMIGLEGTVASLGTALTPEQAKLMKRYSSKVYIAYDGDSAGQKATLRGLDILREAELEVRVLEFPDGMDADDFARSKGRVGLMDLMDNAPSLNQFLLESIAKEYDTRDIAQRTQFAQRYSREVLSKMASPVERAVYIRMLSQKTGIDEQAIEKEAEAAAPAAPVRVYNSRVQRDTKENTTEKPMIAEPQKISEQSAEESLLGLALEQDVYWNKLREESDLFAGKETSEILEYMKKYGNKVNLHTLALDALSQDAIALLSRINVQEGPDGATEEADRLYDDCVNLLRIQRFDRREKQINDELRKRDMTGEDHKALVLELADLIKKRRAIVH